MEIERPNNSENQAEFAGSIIESRSVAKRGKWLKLAQVHDEVWLQGQPVEKPDSFLTALRMSSLNADLFTFAQSIPETTPKYSYHMEWDNLAVAPTSDFKKWWESLPQESRKNVRRSERRGVVTRQVEFDDALVAGIKKIYDEAPIRQGRRFWHYGKSLETVKKENSSYLERSQFIGAYFQDELIGFIKMVNVGPTARIMQILSMNGHFDKRPTNALLTKAAEICHQRGLSYLIYGQYIYGKKANSQITEFKRRTGFEQLLLPRYFIPLTAKGKIALALKLHRGIRELLPEPITDFLLKKRMAYYERKMNLAKTNATPNVVKAETDGVERAETI